jgi:hypothetical protein
MTGPLSDLLGHSITYRIPNVPLGLPNVLRMSCNARLVDLALNYQLGRALAAPNAG